MSPPEAAGSGALRPTRDPGRGLLRWGRGDQLSQALLGRPLPLDFAVLAISLSGGLIPKVL